MNFIHRKIGEHTIYCYYLAIVILTRDLFHPGVQFNPERFSSRWEMFVADFKYFYNTFKH